jgi:hypothetical protein
MPLQSMEKIRNVINVTMISNLILFFFLLCPRQLGLLGFLAVLGLSKLSARNAKVQFDSDRTAAPSTPQKTPIANRSSSGTPLEEKTGTVMTPAGRRSARIARTRRKEE